MIETEEGLQICSLKFNKGEVFLHAKWSRLNKQRNGSIPRSELGDTEDQKLNVHIENKINSFFQGVSVRGLDVKHKEIGLLRAYKKLKIREILKTQVGHQLGSLLEMRSTPQWVQKRAMAMICDVKNTLCKQRLEKPSLFGTETGSGENKRDAVSPAACKKGVPGRKELSCSLFWGEFCLFYTKIFWATSLGEKGKKTGLKPKPKPQNKTQNFLIWKIVGTRHQRRLYKPCHWRTVSETAVRAAVDHLLRSFPALLLYDLAE